MSETPQEKKSQEQNPPKENNQRSRRTITLFVLVALVALLAIKVFFDQHEKSELKEYYQTELEQSQTKLKEISEELEQKIHEIDSLGGDITELLAAKEEVEKERDQLTATRQANRQLIGRLRRKTEGYEELLKEKDKEIVRLKKVAEQLMTENTSLKTEKNELNRSIVDLNQDKKKLEDKDLVRQKVESYYKGYLNTYKPIAPY